MRKIRQPKHIILDQLEKNQVKPQQRVAQRTQIRNTAKQNNARQTNPETCTTITCSLAKRHRLRHPQGHDTTRVSHDIQYTETLIATNMLRSAIIRFLLIYFLPIIRIERYWVEIRRFGFSKPLIALPTNCGWSWQLNILYYS